MSIASWQIIVIVLVFIVPYVLIIYGGWNGVRRAGYKGAWSLILLLPLLNIIMLYVFAFATWPVERQQRNDTSG